MEETFIFFVSARSRKMAEEGAVVVRHDHHGAWVVEEFVLGHRMWRRRGWGRGWGSGCRQRKWTERIVGAGAG